MMAQKREEKKMKRYMLIIILVYQSESVFRVELCSLA